MPVTGIRVATPPIQTPVHQQPIARTDGKPTNEFYQWTQTLTTFLGQGKGPNYQTLTALTFLALRRSV